MPRYIVTRRAGPWVAGRRTSGAGTMLELTLAEAEHELRLGTLIAVPQRCNVEAGPVILGPSAAPSPAMVVQARPLSPIDPGPRRRRRKAS